MKLRWRRNVVSSMPRRLGGHVGSLAIFRAAAAAIARRAVDQLTLNERATAAVERSQAARAGVICSATSVNDSTPQPAAGQHHRHLCQMGRTGQPNAGRSTNRTGAEPLDHTVSQQLPQAGRRRVRMCSPKALPASLSTPRISTSPGPANDAQIRG